VRTQQKTIRIYLLQVWRLGLVKREASERRTLVYVRQTGTRDIQDRRQAGFAHPARASDCNQTDVGSVQSLPQLRGLVLTPDKTRLIHQQIRVGH
jgi:hypothetical protein